MPSDLRTSLDPTLTGNKAYHLSLMKKEGFAVPDGFVLHAEESLAPEEISIWTSRYYFPSSVAVRSSARDEDCAAHSAAGLHETLLEVATGDVADAVEQIRRHECSERGMPVIVQRYIPAVMAGVAFSINPVTGHDQVYIEYGQGSCQSIVSGAVIPDSCSLQKDDVKGAGVLVELTRHLVRLEAIMGIPVDVEWCVDGASNLWLLQCRPVTVIPESSFTYAWSAREPLWGMELAFQARCNDSLNRQNGCYTHREIIYSRTQDGAFHCYLGAVDRAAALKYSVLALELEEVNRDTTADGANRTFSPDTAASFFDYWAGVYSHSISEYLRSEPIVTCAIERSLLLLLGEQELAASLSDGNDDLMLREQRAFDAIKLDISSILDHVEKYPYLSLGFMSRHAMIDALQEMAALRRSERVRNKPKSRFVAKLPVRESQWLLYLRRTSMRRMSVKAIWAGVYLRMMTLMEWLATAYGESVEDIYRYYCVGDIKRLISTGECLSAVDKKRRALGVTMARSPVTGARPEITFGQSFNSSRQGMSCNSSCCLRGMPSLRHRVAGEVVKIADYGDLSLARIRGKIVVTEMTQPNMLTVLRECLGIITDEGGLLSHACVLAREYDLPCIVGTHNATLQLRDGERVVMWPDGRVSREG